MASLFEPTPPSAPRSMKEWHRAGPLVQTGWYASGGRAVGAVLVAGAAATEAAVGTVLSCREQPATPSAETSSSGIPVNPRVMGPPFPGSHGAPFRSRAVDL